MDSQRIGRYTDQMPKSMTVEDFRAASARKTQIRAGTLIVVSAAVVFLLLSADPYFDRFDSMRMWLARAVAVLAAVGGFIVGAANDNCPACSRPRGMGLVLQFFLNTAANPGEYNTSKVEHHYKPCALEREQNEEPKS